MFVKFIERVIGMHPAVLRIRIRITFLDPYSDQMIRIRIQQKPLKKEYIGKYQLRTKILFVIDLNLLDYRYLLKNDISVI